MPGRRLEITYVPLAEDVVVRFPWVLCSVAVMVAPAITAPLGSKTVPVIKRVSVWAINEMAQRRPKTDTPNNPTILAMSSSSSDG